MKLRTQKLSPLASVLCLVAAFCMGFIASAQARTVTLTVEDCDLLATLSSLQPEQSWAGAVGHSHLFETKVVNASGREAILLRFRLDRIPKDQRIVRAELLLPLAPGSSPSKVDQSGRARDWQRPGFSPFRANEAY